MIQPGERRDIFLRYSHGKVTNCCMSVFLYVGFAARRRQSQYIKAAKYFFHRYSRQNGDGTNPTCTRKRRFTFPGYIDENAIHNNFQRVPLPDGFVCKVHAIAVEMELSSLKALFLYEHAFSTRIQKRRKLSVSYAIGNESEPTGVPQVSFFTL